MNEILQKRIEEAAMQVPFERGTRESFRDGATFILSHLWISVDEALPIIGKDGYVDVFIIIKKNKKTLTYTARFEDNKFWNIDGFGVYQGVTHWMEIPSLEGGGK